MKCIIAQREFNAALRNLSKHISMDHEGAVFVSTEIALLDGTTLELGLREAENSDDYLEIIIKHNTGQSVASFLGYKADCARRLRALHGGKEFDL